MRFLLQPSDICISVSEEAQEPANLETDLPRVVDINKMNIDETPPPPAPTPAAIPSAPVDTIPSEDLTFEQWKERALKSNVNVASLGTLMDV